MSFHSDQAFFLGIGNKFIFQRFGGKPHGDIRPAAAGLFNGALVEIGVGIDRSVEQVFLGGVNFFNTGQAALFLDPLQYQFHNINRENRGSIIQ